MWYCTRTKPTEKPLNFCVVLWTALTLLMNFAKHTPLCALIKATDTWYTYTLKRFTAVCIMLIILLSNKRVGGIGQHRYIQNTITGGGTTQKFNYFFSLSRHTAHYALMCVSPSRKLGFDSAHPHYWQASTWEIRYILTPRADSHLH